MRAPGTLAFFVLELDDGNALAVVRPKAFVRNVAGNGSRDLLHLIDQSDIFLLQSGHEAGAKDGDDHRNLLFEPASIVPDGLLRRHVIPPTSYDRWRQQAGPETQPSFLIQSGFNANGNAKLSECMSGAITGRAPAAAGRGYRATTVENTARELQKFPRY